MRTPLLNRPGFKAPHVWLTASVLGSGNGCARNSVLDAFFRHNGNYTNWHLQFGSTFGAAAAAIAIHWDGSNKIETMRHVLAQSLTYPVHAEVGFKSVRSMWKVLLMFFRQWQLMYDDGWRYHSSEVASLVEIQFDNHSAKTGGAYDLCIQRDGILKLIDFKSVGSNYFYSWDYDTQLVWYMLTQACNTTGLKPIYAQPEYWTFVFKTEDPVLEIYRVEPTVFTSVVAGDIATIGTLTSTIASHSAAYADPWSDDSMYKFWLRVPTASSSCKSGNFKCFNYSICHEGSTVNWADPRINYNSGGVPIASATPEALMNIATDIANTWLPDCTTVDGSMSLDDDFDMSLFS